MRWISLSWFVLVLGVLMLLGNRTPTMTASQATGPTPLVEGDAVFHVKAKHVWTTPEGEQKEAREAEFWFDPVTQDARYDERSLTRRYHTVLRRKGLTFSIQFPLEGQVSTETFTDANAPMLQRAQENVLYYKAALARGELRPISTQVLDYEPADVVQRKVAFEGVDVLKAWINKGSGLAIKEIAYRQGQFGGLEEVEKHDITYTLIERVDRGEMPTDLFSVPAAERRSSQESLTLPLARQYKEFDIYWVGPNFDAMPLSDINITASVNGDQPGRVSTLHVIYAEPILGEQSNTPKSLQIHQSSAASMGGSTIHCGNDLDAATGETVGGRRATLCNRGSEGIQLNWIVGGTFVTISGQDRQQVLKAAESLQKLN